MDGFAVQDQELGRIKNCTQCEYLLPEMAHFCDICGYPQADIFNEDT